MSLCMSLGQMEAVRLQAEACVVQNRPGTYSCTVCGYEASGKQRLVYHVEARHLETQGYQCDICQKACRTKNALLIHKSRFHRQQLS